MISCTKILEFDAGHRVVNHESKCRTIHGHRYSAHIEATRKKGLDGLGRVIDFSVIKEKLGGWIDKHWDHAFIAWERDPDLEILKKISGMKDIYTTKFNPTAENMARFLLKDIAPIVFKEDGIEVVKIVLWETPSCYATAEKKTECKCN